MLNDDIGDMPTTTTIIIIIVITITIITITLGVQPRGQFDI